MPRWFNVGGPCYADEHYVIPAARRAAEAATLIGQGRWFSLVSGRQTGKTTVVQHLAATLNAEGKYRALWVDLENVRGLDDPPMAFATMLDVLDASASAVGLSGPDAAARAEMRALRSLGLLRYLSALSAASDRPLVLFLDGADGLKGAAMVSFLTQLRALYFARHDQAAPRSLVLVGARDVRDVVTEEAPGAAVPFNVTTENIALAAFTEAEVGELVAQHTAETGQRFEPEAIAHLHYLSAGHPWLVNALADQVARWDVPDRAVAITAAHIEAAKESLLLAPRGHLEALCARLREERVRRVLDPMLAGAMVWGDFVADDVGYLVSLGLLRLERSWVVANPLYREMIPRALAAPTQATIVQQTAGYVGADGLLDVPKLMAAWQTFWREDGHLAAEGFAYRKSGPHLMLMAFLQRVVNGGGRIDREYALGKGALDLLITWKTQRIAVEVKLRRETETEARALEQVVRYLDHLGLAEGWLVLLDLRATTGWETRLYTRTETVGARRVHLVGC